MSERRLLGSTISADLTALKRPLGLRGSLCSQVWGTYSDYSRSSLFLSGDSEGRLCCDRLLPVLARSNECFKCGFLRLVVLLEVVRRESVEGFRLE